MKKEETRTLDPDFFNYLMDLEVKKAVRYLYFFSLVMVQSDPPFDDPEKGRSSRFHLDDLIRQEVRETDIMGWTGNGRLFLILHQADAFSVVGVGNRIRERIEQHNFHVDQKNVRLTVSLGGASFPSHANELDSLIQKAGEALTWAKEHGGNRICVPEEGLTKTHRHETP